MIGDETYNVQLTGGKIDVSMAELATSQKINITFEGAEATVPSGKYWTLKVDLSDTLSAKMNVTLDGSSKLTVASADGLRIANGSTLTLDEGSELIVNSGALLRVGSQGTIAGGGTITNSGTVTLHKGDVATEIATVNPAITLTSSGVVYSEFAVDSGKIGPAGNVSTATGNYTLENVMDDKGQKVNFTYKYSYRTSGGGTVTPTPTPDTEELPFTDVAEGQWFYEAVQYVYDAKLMNGITDTTFEPDSTTTRGMIVTVLYRMAGEPEVTGESAFTDVAEGSWYADAINWAAANEIVNGYGDGIFAPDTDITREQMAAILYRYAQYKGFDVSVGEDTNILSYTDFDAISEYAIPALQWACGAGVIQGVTEDTLVPQGTATRAQVATILMRFCENVAK